MQISGYFAAASLRLDDARNADELVADNRAPLSLPQSPARSACAASCRPLPGWCAWNGRCVPACRSLCPSLRGRPAIPASWYRLHHAHRNLLRLIHQSLGHLLDQSLHVPTLLACHNGAPDNVWAEDAALLLRCRACRGRLCHQLGDGIGKFGPLRDPLLDALALQINGGRAGAGIVGSHHLHRASIARAILLYDDYAIIGLLARTNARQTYH